MKDHKKTKEQLITELTQLRQQVAQLREFEARYNQLGQAQHKDKERYTLLARNVIENTRDIIYSATPDGTVTFVNSQVSCLGYEPEDVIGHRFAEFIHPDDVSGVLEAYQRTVETGGNAPTVFRLVAKDKTAVYVEEFGRAIREDDTVVQVIGVLRDITQRMSVEAALRQSQTYSRNIIESSLDMIIAVNQERKITEFNKAAQKAFGYSPEEVIGKHVNILYAESEKGIQVHDTTVKQGQCIQEVLNKRKNGEVFPSYLSASVLRDESGELVGVMGVSRDITEQKRMEAENIRLAAFPRESPHPVLESDAQGNIQYVNPAAESLLNKLRLERVTDLLPPDHEKLVRAFLKEGESFFGIGVSVRNRIFSWSYHPVPNAGVVRLYGADITDQQRAADNLRRERDKAQSYLDIAGVVIVALDVNGKVTLINGKGCDVLEYKEEEIIGKNWFDHFVPGNIKERAKGVFEGLIAGGVEPLEYHEIPILTKSGRERLIAWHNRILTDKSGKPNTLLISGEDITEHRKAEQELIRLSLAVEQAAETIMITEPDGTIVYVNPAFEAITGYSCSEAIGKNPRILKSGNQSLEFYRNLWSTLGQGEIWSGRFVNRRKDGRLYDEEAVISPVRDASGNIIHFVAVKRDVTQELTLTAQLQQAQKMEAIGALAGGVAHDFNNLLTTIMGFAELALLENGLDSRVREHIARIPEQGRRAAKLISQLLAFSRRAVTERQTLSLSAAIKETAKMLERTISENVSIVLDIPKSAAMINADPTQIQQVILNLRSCEKITVTT